MANTITKNGKIFVRQARLPRGAYPQKPLPEVLEPYMKGNPNWQNLKENKCPRCYKDFMNGLETVPSGNIAVGQLLMHPCGFKIRERRYSQIVNSQITASLTEKLQQEQEELL